MTAALVLPAQLTQEEAPACLQQLLAKGRAAGASWVVDAGALQTFDSAALAVLLELRRQALAAGAGLKLENASARLRELVSLYGLGELLPA